MPAEKTRLDSIREYLTGAASDNGVQTNQAASLGNFRSSTEAASYSISVSSPIANISVLFAAGGNAAGAGSLQCLDANTLQWKEAGGSYGAAQSISNGQTVILESATGPGSFIRVSRTSATALVPGTATVTLTAQVDNVYSGSDITPAQAASGVTIYRAVMLRNEAAGSVTGFFKFIGQIGSSQTTNSAQLSGSGAGTITTTGSFADWPGSGFAQVRSNVGVLKEIVYYTSRTNTSLTVPAAGRALDGTSATAGAGTDIVYSTPGIAIAIDTAGVQAFGASIQVVANETTAPTSVVWNHEIVDVNGLNIGTMATATEVGIWVKHFYPAGTMSLPNNLAIMGSTYNAA